MTSQEYVEKFASSDDHNSHCLTAVGCYMRNNITPLEQLDNRSGTCNSWYWGELKIQSAVFGYLKQGHRPQYEQTLSEWVQERKVADGEDEGLGYNITRDE